MKQVYITASQFNQPTEPDAYIDPDDPIYAMLHPGAVNTPKIEEDINTTSSSVVINTRSMHPNGK